MTAQWDYSKPYADVIAVAISYFHPDTRDAQAIEDLHHVAGLDPMPDWFRDFETQLTLALEQHLEGATRTRTWSTPTTSASSSNDPRPNKPRCSGP